MATTGWSACTCLAVTSTCGSSAAALAACWSASEATRASGNIQTLGSPAADRAGKQPTGGSAACQARWVCSTIRGGAIWNSSSRLTELMPGVSAVLAISVSRVCWLALSPNCNGWLDEPASVSQDTPAVLVRVSW